MNIRELSSWLGLDQREVKTTVAKGRKCKRDEVGAITELTLPECKLVWDTFPLHDKVLIIRCKTRTAEPGTERFVCSMAGNWDGRLWRAVNRVFNKAYRKFAQSIQQGRDDVEFKTWPSADEIRIDKQVREARIAEMLAAKELAEKNEVGQAGQEKQKNQKPVIATAPDAVLDSRPAPTNIPAVPDDEPQPPPFGTRPKPAEHKEPELEETAEPTEVTEPASFTTEVEGASADMPKRAVSISEEELEKQLG